MTLPAPLPVRLHHLAPEAAAAGERFPDLDLTVSDLAVLRSLLTALGAIAAGPLLPRGTAPEIRIRTTREELIVRIGGGGLRVISWESPVGGSPMSVDRILETVLPPPAPPPRPRARPVAEPEEESRPASAPSNVPWLKIVSLGLAILAINGITAWMLLRPDPDFLPEYELMDPDESARLLRGLAGDYETGSKEGDRTLTIAPNGYMRLAVYGRFNEIREETTQIARGARSEDRPILITSETTSVEIRDANTLVLYGNTYRRR